MADKWIPNGNLDFITKAEHLARTIAADPARFEISPEDSAELTAAAADFRAALSQYQTSGRSEATRQARNQSRAALVRIVRRIGHLLRANQRLDAVAKCMLGMRPRGEKPKVASCPPEPPRLRFVRALHEGGATPVHELSFKAFNYSSARPEGAVRLELFVDLVPPDEPIPGFPGDNHNSRPWYLRSFVRSPIKLTPPMANVPMRVVYWGRWADALGNVGPFSATAVAWIEGGSHALLPGGVGFVRPSLGAPAPIPILNVEPSIAAAQREPKYSVALLDAQFESLHPQQIEAAPPRQLQGPAVGEIGGETGSETEAA